jgi:hypothetical protein
MRISKTTGLEWRRAEGRQAMVGTNIHNTQMKIGRLTDSAINHQAAPVTTIGKKTTDRLATHGRITNRALGVGVRTLNNTRTHSVTADTTDSKPSTDKPIQQEGMLVPSSTEMSILCTKLRIAVHLTGITTDAHGTPTGTKVVGNEIAATATRATLIQDPPATPLDTLMIVSKAEHGTPTMESTGTKMNQYTMRATTRRHMTSEITALTSSEPRDTFIPMTTGSGIMTGQTNLMATMKLISPG